MKINRLEAELKDMRMGKQRLESKLTDKDSVMVEVNKKSKE